MGGDREPNASPHVVRRRRIGASVASVTLLLAVVALIRWRVESMRGAAAGSETSATAARPVERCNGENDDGDAEVDEGCSCRGQMVSEFPEFAFRVGGVVVTDAGALLAIDAGSGALLEGTSFRRVTGTELEQLRAHELRLERGRLVHATAPAAPVPGAPDGIEVFGGDARTWVAVTEDGTIHHGGAGPVRTSRLDRAPPDDLYVRGADAVFAVSAAHRVSFWDGRRWSTLLERPGERLSLVAGDSHAIFVHGRDLTTDEHVVHHHDGRSWTMARFRSPDVPRKLVVARGQLYSLSTANGLFRFTGARYEIVGEANFDAIHDLHGHTGTSVFAAGGRCVLHYDGLHWTRIHCESDVSLHAVHAPSDDLAYVVGVRHPPVRGVVLRCTPRSCTEVGTPGTSLLTSVWARDERSIEVGSELGHLFHFDGQTWSPVHAAPLPVLAIEGDAHAVYVALGGLRTEENSARGGLLRSDGSSYRTEDVPSWQELRAIAVLADGGLAVGGGNDAYAEYGSILFTIHGDEQVSVPLGEEASVRALAPLPNGFLSLASTRTESDAGDTWGQDTWSLRLHQGGGSRLLVRNETQTGTALFAASERDVFVVGNGEVFHYCGPRSIADLH